MVDVFSQSVGFFDDLNLPTNNIMPSQVSISEPSLPTLENATGLISPDQATLHRMAHFDGSIYDLRPESHLVRFFQTLLGDAGAGQLRKRYTMARLQTTFNGTHFYDLDGFYGALFSAQRKVSERLPINPMSATATPDEWDDIASRDARYRERLYALARALPMAGTIPGLQQAAEALTGVECDVYETWKIYSDNAVQLGQVIVTSVTRYFNNVESDFINWDSFELTKETWDSVSGYSEVGHDVGLAQITNRDEVIIRPKISYTPVDGSNEAFREAERQRQEDEMNVQRVLNILKPASVLLTVDNQGVAVHVPTQIAAMEADSNYWEIITKVKPRSTLSTISSPYPVMPITGNNGGVDDAMLNPLPKPPFSNSQGYQWSYNSIITSVNGLTVKEATSEVSGIGTVINQKNWEKVSLGDTKGSFTEYLPSMGITDQRALLAAQASADSVLIAHPYSGSRVVVPTND